MQVLLLWFTITSLQFSSTENLSELGQALLDTDFMPLRLIEYSGKPKRESSEVLNPINNTSMKLALATMNFHRQKMNEFLCRDYEARNILEAIQENSENVKEKQYFPESSLHKRMIMLDEGSLGYSRWLRRSTQLENIYHDMEGDNEGSYHGIRRVNKKKESEEVNDDDDGDNDDDNNDEDELEIVREEQKKNEQNKVQKGSRGRNRPKGQTNRKRKRPVTENKPQANSHEIRDTEYSELDNIEYSSIPHQDIVYAESWSGLSFNSKDMFDISLTALAFLAFGLFILNVFLNIVTQKVGPQRVFIVSNNTTPSLPVQKREINWSMDNVTLERAMRWAEQAPEFSQRYTEEKIARLALYTLTAALNPKSENCMPFALCWGNKLSRDFNGQSKYLLPIWSMGMSWIARRTAEGSQPGLASLFSGALDNIRAAALGLAGVRCKELFPQC